jgi:hypothetical protein
VVGLVCRRPSLGPSVLTGQSSMLTNQQLIQNDRCTTSESLDPRLIRTMQDDLNPGKDPLKFVATEEDEQESEDALNIAEQNKSRKADIASNNSYGWGQYLTVAGVLLMNAAVVYTLLRLTPLGAKLKPIESDILAKLDESTKTIRESASRHATEAKNAAAEFS